MVYDFWCFLNTQIKKIKVQLWKNSIEHMVEIINNKIDDLMMCWLVLLMDDIFVKVEITIQGE